MTPPRVSVVVATCFQPVSLRLVLAGYRAQTFKDFELLLADDGSCDETTRVLEELKPRCAFPIQRYWQSNQGFRKSIVLNHAALHTRGSLLVFSDGDCIPAPDFLKRHVDQCPSEGFSVGGWVNMTLDETKTLTEENVEEGEMLRYLSPEARREHRSIHLKNVVYGWFGKRHRPRIRGRNVAIARAPFFRINGWDENFVGVGKEDSDFRDRLRMMRAPSVSLYGRATVYHTHNDIDVSFQSSLKKRSGGRDYYDTPGRPAWCANGLFKEGVSDDETVKRVIDRGGDLEGWTCDRCGADRRDSTL